MNLGSADTDNIIYSRFSGAHSVLVYVTTILQVHCAECISLFLIHVCICVDVDVYVSVPSCVQRSVFQGMQQPSNNALFAVHILYSSFSSGCRAQAEASCSPLQALLCFSTMDKDSNEEQPTLLPSEQCAYCNQLKLCCYPSASTTRQREGESITLKERLTFFSLYLFGLLSPLSTFIFISLTCPHQLQMGI